MDYMKLDDLILLCEQLEDTVHDCPFDEPDHVVFRHKENRKWFGLTCYLDSELCINVKCSPYNVDALCEMYKGITPGWHMNKRHWITIHTDSDVPYSELVSLLHDSYELTKPKKKDNKKGSM